MDSLALANAQMNLQTAYNNFFRNPKVVFPKFKSKHRNKNSYTTNNQKGSIDIEKGCLKLPKIGFVKLKQHRIIPSDYKIKSVTISQTPSGNYCASVFCLSTKTKYRKQNCKTFWDWIFLCTNFIKTATEKSQSIRDTTDKPKRN